MGIRDKEYFSAPEPQPKQEGQKSLKFSDLEVETLKECVRFLIEDFKSRLKNCPKPEEANDTLKQMEMLLFRISPVLLSDEEYESLEAAATVILARLQSEENKLKYEDVFSKKFFESLSAAGENKTPIEMLMNIIVKINENYKRLEDEKAH